MKLKRVISVIIMIVLVLSETRNHRMNYSRKKLLGFVLLAINIVSWSSSSLAVQALQRAVPDFQLGALRYIGCMLVSIIWIYIQKPSLHLLKVQCAYIVAMSMASILYNVCYFSAVSLLPLTNASALSMSLRMISFTLMMRIKFQEPLDSILIISVVGCTLGMVFIAQPWSDFTNGFTPSFLISKTENTMQFNISMSSITNVSSSIESIQTSDIRVVYQTLLPGYLLSIVAAVADGIYMVVVTVYLKSVNPAVQCFASACICFPISMLISFYVEQPIIISGTINILLVSIHVVATGINLVSEITTLQLLNPIMVSVIENVDTITYIIPQYTFMGLYMYGRKNVLEVFGCILIAIFAGLSSLSSCGHHHEDFT